MRTKKAVINIIANIIVQITSIIIGLLVPKILINNYGSSINGLIQMITQIVSYFGIIEGRRSNSSRSFTIQTITRKKLQ